MCIENEKKINSSKCMQCIDDWTIVHCTECPSDFTLVPAINGCYKFNANGHPWEQAGVECRKFHERAHLLVIDNVAEQVAIASAMENLFLKGKYSNWIRSDG